MGAGLHQLVRLGGIGKGKDRKGLWRDLASDKFWPNMLFERPANGRFFRDRSGPKACAGDG